MKKISKIGAALCIAAFTSTLFNGVFSINAYAAEVPKSENFDAYDKNTYAGQVSLADWTYSILDTNGNDDTTGTVSPLQAPYIQIVDKNDCSGAITNISKAICFTGNYGTDNAVKIKSNKGSFNLSSFSLEDNYSDCDASSGNDVDVQFTVYGYKNGSSIAAYDFKAGNGSITQLDFESDSKWSNIDEFRIICHNNYNPNTPNISILLDNIQVSVPVSLANEANNFIKLSSSTVEAGDTITITAAGDRQGEAGTTVKDERYIPKSWTSTEEGKTGDFALNNGTYTSTYVPDKQGTYAITVKYDKQVWNGSIWTDSNPLVTDTKIETVTVNPADSVIIPSAPAFDKYGGGIANSPIEVTMQLKGNTLVSIVNGNNPLDTSKMLTLNKDYTISANVVTINKDYLASQNTGTISLIFNFSAGNPQSINIIIMDLTPTITVKNNNEQYGTISVTGGTSLGNDTYKASYGTTVCAYPKQGCNFIGWYDSNNNIISINPTYRVDYNNSVYIAKFEVSRAALTVNIEGQGSVSDSNGTWSSGTSKQYSVGTVVALTAVNDTNSIFAYWQDENGRVLSTSGNYSVTIGSNTVIKAVFITKQNNTHLVIFKKENGDIIQTTCVTNGEDVVYPKNPFMYGYSFHGWDTTPVQAKSATSDIVIKALFEKNTTKCKVNVTNGKLNNGTTYEEYDMKEYVTVIADAAPENKKFSNWKDSDGNVLSYDAAYKFYVTSDVTLEAVYVDNSDQVNPKASIVIKSVAIDKTANKISFTAERFVPDDCTVISHGIIVTKDASLTNDTFVIGAAGVLKGTAKTFGSRGTYILNIGNANATIYARGYIVYKDKSGNVFTIYSSIAQGKIN